MAHIADNPKIIRFVKWIVFSVIISLLPLVFNLLSALNRQKEASLSLLCSHGELLILSAAIAAGSIGELFGGGSERAILKIIAGGGCVAVLFVACLSFADVAQLPQPVPSVVTVESITIFILTLISSASCIALSDN